MKVAVVGLGKMGLSHHAIINTHPDAELAGVCDSSSYVLAVLRKYTGVPTFTDYDDLLEVARPDAVIIATPSRTHAPMVREALTRGIHVFCEKPFTLDPTDADDLTALAKDKGLVTQVGYHYRFVGAFAEVKRLLDQGAIGDVNHALAETYGPVVLKPKGGTWRSQRDEGGGCLRDYAAHSIDLLGWYLGEAKGVGGSCLASVFSREIEDAVVSTLYFGGGTTAQVWANWSDESYRRMTTRVNLWGTRGRIYADRQECQVYLRDNAELPPGYEPGWNVRYTTDLTEPVWFYLRGEEYTAQLAHFLDRVRRKELEGVNTFASAAAADRVMSLIIADAAKGASTESQGELVPAAPDPGRSSPQRMGAAFPRRLVDQALQSLRKRRSMR